MKKIAILIIFLFFNNNLIADEKIDCTKLKKITEKISCKTKSIGSKIKNTSKKIVPEKIRNKKINLLPKSFSEKKTLADFFKKKE